jgi:hypothetical protein
VIALVAGVAWAADLPSMTAAGAWADAAEAVATTAAAETKDKKRAKALDALGLSDVRPPIGRAIGADLALGAPESLGCGWDGSITCAARATAQAGVATGDYQLVCRSPLGVRLPLPTVAERDGDAMVWTARTVETCWKVGLGALSLEPVGDVALEGAGVGTDLIPPERVALSKLDAEARIQAAAPGFAACLRTTTGDRAARSGVIEVGYHIGPTGVIDRVEVARATATDPALTACVLERFGKLTFPPPNGGFEEGTFPLSFQDADAR